MTPAQKKQRTWKCYLGLFVICWAVERWKAIAAHLDSPDAPTTASEDLRYARTRLDL